MIALPVSRTCWSLLLLLLVISNPGDSCRGNDLAAAADSRHRNPYLPSAELVSLAESPRDDFPLRSASYLNQRQYHELYLKTHYRETPHPETQQQHAGMHIADATPAPGLDE